ncbi:hemolysin III family protein [Sulfitobacter sp. PR48]|uniref:Hemolysin III family protein n=1 Tax=Sulfitobacter porphyrae TaxID=1246864 RepID=A0ABW2B501_9RHOB|nr:MULTISPECIES: hemolysin III family protein [unclassified Sulfitobacter]MCZ4255084.1 hemolysin III family protein [Sulfitobacter sp. G21635-S1]MDD9723012.1 hemolysin III family protein [Sulfitobacter sp. PR48]
MAYPYSRSETWADGAVHVAGLVLAIPASVLLLVEAAGSQRLTTAAALYAGCMIFAFAASAIYHLSPIDRTRPLLNRIDHAAIYFKIAGTYTPFVALIGSGFAYAVLGIVWALALVGAVAKLWFWGTDGRGSLALYLLMGWLAVLLFWPMWQVLPPAALFLVSVGGIIYSVGAWVFAKPAFRFQNAIWHSFVLSASTCFFAAVAIALQIG